MGKLENIRGEELFSVLGNCIKQLRNCYELTHQNEYWIASIEAEDCLNLLMSEYYVDNKFSTVH